MPKSMGEIVRKGYDNYDYLKKFRKSDKPTSFEKRFLTKFVSLLPKNAQVLDLGCGSGIPFDKYFTHNGCHVTGIDFSEKHLEQAKKNVPNAQFISADFSKISFSNAFDGVASFYAIFHIPYEEHKRLFAKIARALRSKGVILVTLGTAKGYFEAANWCGTRMAWSSCSPEKYLDLLEKAGFKVLESRFEGSPGDEEHHFWVLARKKK